MRVFVYLLLIVLSIGCSENDKPEKPISEKQKTLNELMGTWSTDCSPDFNTTFFRNLEERYTATTFELIATLHDSDNCSENAIAREVVQGTYQVLESVDVILNVPAGKNESIKAWEIDYTVKDVVLSGNALTLLPGDQFFVVGNDYYNTISLKGNIKYDGIYEFEKSLRPITLDYSQQRTTDLINAAIQTPPVYDTANLPSQFIGNWFDECYNDSETDGAEEYGEESLIIIPTANTIVFDTAIWTQEDCGGDMVAGLALSGTFTVIDTFTTDISSVNASIVEITFNPTVDYYFGEKLVADKSMPYAGDAGGSFYMLMFYESSFDLLFTGGFLEPSQNFLPDDFDWVMTRFN